MTVLSKIKKKAEQNKNSFLSKIESCDPRPYVVRSLLISEFNDAHAVCFVTFCFQWARESLETVTATLQCGGSTEYNKDQWVVLAVFLLYLWVLVSPGARGQGSGRVRVVRGGSASL